LKSSSAVCGKIAQHAASEQVTLDNLPAGCSGVAPKIPKVQTAFEANKSVGRVLKGHTQVSEDITELG
jgi:hypothetical protein